MLTLYWIRHAESESNAIALYEPWYNQFKRLFIRDPNLTQKGVLQASSAVVPSVDVVCCSQLRRAIQTALLMYPTKTIYVVNGLNEIIPSLSSTPLDPPDLLKGLNPFDQKRISFKYTKPCGYFESMNIHTFESAFLKLQKDTKAKSIAIVGHSQWMRYHLGLSLDNAQIVRRVLP